MPCRSLRCFLDIKAEPPQEACWDIYSTKTMLFQCYLFASGLSWKTLSDDLNPHYLIFRFMSCYPICTPGNSDHWFYSGNQNLITIDGPSLTLRIINSHVIYWYINQLSYVWMKRFKVYALFSLDSNIDNMFTMLTFCHSVFDETWAKD